jgi:hypothetical protein
MSDETSKAMSLEERTAEKGADVSASGEAPEPAGVLSKRQRKKLLKHQKWEEERELRK